MQNTFSQSGNDSKWFLKKSFFKIGKWHSRPPRDPPPFMANAILNFHFDYLTPSLNIFLCRLPGETSFSNFQVEKFLQSFWQYCVWKCHSNTSFQTKSFFATSCARFRRYTRFFWQFGQFWQHKTSLGGDNAKGWRIRLQKMVSRGRKVEVGKVEKVVIASPKFH